MTVSAVVGGVTATYIQSGGGHVSAIAVKRALCQLCALCELRPALLYAALCPSPRDTSKICAITATSNQDVIGRFH